MLENLTVGIVAKNEEDRIERAILSCKRITNKILVIDGFSTDNTVTICQKLGVTVLQNKFEGYCNQKNYMISKCKTEWILSLDADEEIT